MTYVNNLEKDVQDVYITNLQIENAYLLVTNEKGEIYKINLKTGNKVTDNEKNNKLNILNVQTFVSLCLVVLLVYITRVFFFK